MGPLSAYDRNLLHLGESHELLILNNLPRFPNSSKFTCFPHSGGGLVWLIMSWSTRASLTSTSFRLPPFL
nr:hypothetical protein Q903MT_gene2961 [Picea sitchensis]